jgi:hypothetical protein
MLPKFDPSFLRFFLYQIRDAFTPTRRLLAELRAKWGRPGDSDGWLASRYFDLTRHEVSANHVDDKTWSDLEFPRIFSAIDTTLTRPGSQWLFKRLRVYADDPQQLTEQYGVYDTLRADAALREKILLKLAYMREDSNANIADYLFGEAPDRQKYFVPVLLWSLFSVALLAALIATSSPVLPWLIVVAFNALVVLRLSRHLNRNVETLKACARMLRVADGLAALSTGSRPIPALARLAEEAPRRAEARNAIRWFSIHQTNELAASLILWLNFGFLVELLSYIHAINKFVRFRAELASTYELVGSLDAAVAIASFLERFPEHCEPVVSQSPLIAVENGYHPLLAHPVKNSIRLDRRSALVTGSNMAGKTTFIKMVGINVIFGRTMGFCFASQAVIPRSNVMAAIRGDHSIESGKSHYFAEIEAVHAFIESAKRGECKVFVIDELFSGTNTVERLAAARAVLESISQNAQVLVTTHDVELQPVLADRYDLYHFQEDPDVEGFFDYRLRAGAATARNAIRLLDRMKFPPEVVKIALAYADKNSAPESS